MLDAGQVNENQLQCTECTTMWSSIAQQLYLWEPYTYNNDYHMLAMFVPYLSNKKG